MSSISCAARAVTLQRLCTTLDRASGCALEAVVFDASCDLSTYRHIGNEIAENIVLRPEMIDELRSVPRAQAISESAFWTMVVALGPDAFDPGAEVGGEVARSRENVERAKAVIAKCVEESDAELARTSGHVLRCRCGSINVRWVQKQTRSADEGMSNFCTCADCNRSWKM